MYSEALRHACISAWVPAFAGMSGVCVSTRLTP